MEEKNKVIISLDVDSLERAEDLIEELSGDVEIFKIGSAPFVNFGERIIDKLNKKNKKIFLDLKFHDIPNTVRQAAQAALKKNVFMLNFHASGGRKMLEEAVKGAGRKRGEKSPVLLGVTILTSMTEEDLLPLGMSGKVEDRVLELATLSKEAGLDGVVASAQEVEMIKENLGDDFLVVTPGIRPAWAASADQRRVVTPRKALERGADYIVIGRPVIEADDPGEAVRKILEEMKG